MCVLSVLLQKVGQGMCPFVTKSGVITLSSLANCWTLSGSHLEQKQLFLSGSVGTWCCSGVSNIVCLGVPVVAQQVKDPVLLEYATPSLGTSIYGSGVVLKRKTNKQKISGLSNRFALHQTQKRPNPTADPSGQLRLCECCKCRAVNRGTRGCVWLTGQMEKPCFSNHIQPLLFSGPVAKSSSQGWMKGT